MDKKKQFHILFYVSSHGFGHSTRMIEVANYIPLAYRVTFVTLSPEWLYDINLRRPFYFRKKGLDTGVLQKYTLTILSEETLKKYSSFISSRDEYINEEVNWLKENKVDLIVSDIPPLVFSVARKVGIPSVGITNFSWDWIYRPMVEDYPCYKYILDDICKDYREADLLLRLPLYGDLSVFPRIKDIPFIARKSRRSKEEVRKKLNILEGKKFILLSLGGFDVTEINFSRISKDFRDVIFFTFNNQISHPEIILLSNRGDLLHEEVLGAADLVICKPGYSTVSEIIVNKTPALFTSRKGLNENDILVEGLFRYAISEEISNKDFSSGNWTFYIDKLLSRQEDWPEADCSGAAIAAEEILGFLK